MRNPNQPRRSLALALFVVALAVTLLAGFSVSAAPTAHAAAATHTGKGVGASGTLHVQAGKPVALPSGVTATVLGSKVVNGVAGPLAPYDCLTLLDIQLDVTGPLSWESYGQVYNYCGVTVTNIYVRFNITIECEGVPFNPGPGAAPVGTIQDGAYAPYTAYGTDWCVGCYYVNNEEVREYPPFWVQTDEYADGGMNNGRDEALSNHHGWYFKLQNMPNGQQCTVWI